MEYVLVDIKDGKICGLYGGRNEKYTDIYNYICSKDYRKTYKFDDIQKAIKVKNALNDKGRLKPNFEIIVIDEKEVK